MKKIMVIVPHEDDEINITGGILNSQFDKSNCYVVFMTNGDYANRCKTRIKEAKKSCKYLGIKESNVIFLGYPDQYYRAKTHIYHTTKSTRETYCVASNELHYKVFNTHAKCNYDSLLNDMILLINTYKPDIYFTVDFDSHPDHRCLSLIFEKSLGIVLKDNYDYAPLVYKGFAYPTSFKSKKDFNNINIESTKFVSEKYSFCEMQNPYYKFENRVRFPVSESCNRRSLLFNKLYKNIKIHTSQASLLKSYDSIINSDQVFWERKTNNLAFHCKITTSSGNGSYLNDFMLFDCENILSGDTKKPKLISNSWIPDKEDKEKKVKFEFTTSQNISSISLYQNVNSNKYIRNIEITYSDKTKEKYKLNNELLSYIYIYKRDINWLEIKVLDDYNNSGFSEIEIFNDDSTDINYIKILDNDNFVYDNYYFDKFNLSIYSYNKGLVKYLDKKDYNIYQNGKLVDYNALDLTKKKFELKVSLKENENIYDKVIVRKILVISKIKHNVIKFINLCTFNFDFFFVRVVNKIRKFIFGKV